MPTALLAVLEQRSFSSKKLRDRVSPLSQTAFMDPALNH